MSRERIHRMATNFYVFHCPGCHYGHNVLVNGPNMETGAGWQWNGSLTAPTFMPSLLVRGNEFGGTSPRCHSFVRDGKIDFLNDCTHELAGKTVDLPDWDFD
jgi:hypothetical protein